MSAKKESMGIGCFCGKFTPFSGYAYAHARELMLFICPKCRRKWNIINLCAIPRTPTLRRPSAATTKGTRHG